VRSEQSVGSLSAYSPQPRGVYLELKSIGRSLSGNKPEYLNGAICPWSFLLIRFPVFLLGFALYAVFVTAIGGVVWVAWAAWLTLTLPLRFTWKFLAAAFSNDSKKLSDWSGYQEAWKNWAEMFMDYCQGYLPLFSWLM
jgi:hypothetical protein